MAREFSACFICTSLPHHTVNYLLKGNTCNCKDGERKCGKNYSCWSHPLTKQVSNIIIGVVHMTDVEAVVVMLSEKEESGSTLL